MLSKCSCVEVSLLVSDVYCEEMETIRDWERGVKEKASQGNVLKMYIGAPVPHPSSHQDLSSIFWQSVTAID